MTAPSHPTESDAPSIYDKYGGFPAISAIVHIFYSKILKSPTLQGFFKAIDMDRLIDHQVKFLCKALGGPDNYEGANVKFAHRKLGITNRAFGEVAGLLKESLEEAGVEAPDVVTILGVVGGLRDQIVTRPDSEEASVAALPGNKPSVAQDYEKIPVVELLGDAVAIVRAETLLFTYANSTFVSWFGKDPCGLNILDLPLHADPAKDKGIKEKFQAKALEFTFETQTTPAEGRVIPVEYAVKALAWQGGRYIVHGRDLSRIVEKDVMLKSYTSVIEVNNRKLKQEQRAIGELLDNMKQAVFTFGKDYRINPRHSKYVHTIFGDAQIVGRDAIDFIYEGTQVEASKHAALRNEFAFVFANDDLQWTISSFTFPKLVEKVINGQIHEIRLTFEPIYSNNLTSKVMVIMEDVTAVNRARKEAAEKQKDLERVAQLIAVSNDMFRTFADEVDQLFALVFLEIAQVEKDFASLDQAALNQRISRVFRYVHTIKGNASSVRLDAVKDRAHAAEDFLARVGAGSEELNQASLPKLRVEIEIIQSEVEAFKKLRSEILGQESSHEPSMDDQAQLVKVMSQVGQVLTKTRQLQLLAKVKLLERQATQSLAQLTLQRHNNTLRDLARRCKKKVRPLRFAGDIVGFTQALNGKVQEIITHVLRNAIDHGIEAPEERLKKGKPAAGSVRISFNTKESESTLIISDDGRGIDLTKIKKKALASSLVKPQVLAEMADHELIELVFLPGFSTASEVTDISGRGVGMDAVKQAAEELGGHVQLRQQQGGGTQLVVSLPASSR